MQDDEARSVLCLQFHMAWNSGFEVQFKVGGSNERLQNMKKIRHEGNAFTNVLDTTITYRKD